MGQILLGQSGSGAGAGRLKYNLFVQPDEPAVKAGLWIQAPQKGYEDVVLRDSYAIGGEFTPIGTSDVESLVESLVEDRVQAQFNNERIFIDLSKNHMLVSHSFLNSSAQDVLELLAKTGQEDFRQIFQTSTGTISSEIIQNYVTVHRNRYYDTERLDDFYLYVYDPDNVSWTPFSATFHSYTHDPDDYANFLKGCLDVDAPKSYVPYSDRIRVYNFAAGVWEDDILTNVIAAGGGLSAFYSQSVRGFVLPTKLIWCLRNSIYQLHFGTQTYEKIVDLSPFPYYTGPTSGYAQNIHPYHTNKGYYVFDVHSFQLYQFDTSTSSFLLLDQIDLPSESSLFYSSMFIGQNDNAYFILSDGEKLTSCQFDAESETFTEPTLCLSTGNGHTFDLVNMSGMHMDKALQKLPRYSTDLQQADNYHYTPPQATLSINDAWYYDTDFREYPTYIGDGEKWNKIKN